MKKLLLTFLGAIIALSLSAETFADAHRVIKAVDSNDYEHYYYYDALNQLVWEQYGTTRREYVNNEGGKVGTMYQYSWVSADNDYRLTQSEEYTYDAEGNLTQNIVKKQIGTQFETTMTYKYYDYVDGVATYYDEYKNGNLYYMYKQVPEFDEQKRLVKCVVYYADPDDYANPTHETVVYDGKETEYTKTYNEAGDLVAELKNNVTYTYTYTNLAAVYTPADFTAVNNNGNVTLTWAAVDGAEKYIVTYDQERLEVAETRFVAEGINLGARSFAVQAVIEGIERNASFAGITVVDPGNKPITDLIAGQVYETVEETESEELGTRTFYNIPLSWTLPADHSEIEKFYVHYHSLVYGDTYKAVESPVATDYLLKIDPYEAVSYDAEGKPVDSIDIPIYITVIYTTGESEKSNIVTVNPYKALDPTAINAASADHHSVSGKYILNGKVIILNNGRKYTVSGALAE